MRCASQLIGSILISATWYAQERYDVTAAVPNKRSSLSSPTVATLCCSASVLNPGPRTHISLMLTTRSLMLTTRAITYGFLLIASRLALSTGAAPATINSQMADMVQISQIPLVWWQIKSSTLSTRTPRNSPDVEDFLSVDVTIYDGVNDRNETISMTFTTYSAEASAKYHVPLDDQEGYIDEAAAASLSRRQANVCRNFVRCAGQLFNQGVNAAVAAAGTTAQVVNAADSAIRAYLSDNGYALAARVTEGTAVSVVTNIPNYYINLKLAGKTGSSAQCGAERPVDVIESAVELFRAGCEAIQKQEHDFPAGKAFVVNAGNRDLDDTIVYGQGL